MATHQEIGPSLQKLMERNDALEHENKILREELAILKKGLFGRSSERVETGQLLIFDDLEGEGPPEEPAQPAHKPKRKGRKPKGHGRAPFPEHLPREEIELDLPEDERACPECGEGMHLFGEDVCERGHIVPAKLVVLRYTKKKYACPHGHAVKTAAMPDAVVERGKFEASVYAHVTVAKYADHLPLNRLEGIFKRHGVHIAKQTMWDLLVKVDELVAQPVLAQMREELLRELVLHSDETPVTMRVEDGKGTSQGYAWAWRNLHHAGTSKVLVEFKASRSRDGPIDFLGPWSGTLIADGYSGYDEAIRQNGITRAGCLAHARRKVKEALDTGAKDAIGLFRPIQRLFRIERAVSRRIEKEGGGWQALVALRAKVRARRSRGIWAGLLGTAESLGRKRSTLPKSKLGKAIGYIERQQVPLAAFLDDPRLPIHNNDTERDLRHLAVGRKNWLVFGSKRGGDVACRLYSLVLSCKQAGVDPERYIEDVLGRVATTPSSEIATLTPWGWQAAHGASAPDA